MGDSRDTDAESHDYSLLALSDDEDTPQYPGYMISVPDHSSIATEHKQLEAHKLSTAAAPSTTAYALDTRTDRKEVARLQKQSRKLNHYLALKKPSDGSRRLNRDWELDFSQSAKRKSGVPRAREGPRKRNKPGTTASLLNGPQSPAERWRTTTSAGSNDPPRLQPQSTGIPRNTSSAFPRPDQSRPQSLQIDPNMRTFKSADNIMGQILGMVDDEMPRGIHLERIRNLDRIGEIAQHSQWSRNPERNGGTAPGSQEAQPARLPNTRQTSGPSDHSQLPYGHMAHDPAICGHYPMSGMQPKFWPESDPHVPAPPHYGAPYAPAGVPRALDEHQQMPYGYSPHPHYDSGDAHGRPREWHHPAYRQPTNPPYMPIAGHEYEDVQVRPPLVQDGETKGWKKTRRGKRKAQRDERGHMRRIRRICCLCCGELDWEKTDKPLLHEKSGRYFHPECRKLVEEGKDKTRAHERMRENSDRNFHFELDAEDPNVKINLPDVAKKLLVVYDQDRPRDEARKMTKIWANFLPAFEFEFVSSGADIASIYKDGEDYGGVIGIGHALFATDLRSRNEALPVAMMLRPSGQFVELIVPPLAIPALIYVETKTEDLNAISSFVGPDVREECVRYGLPTRPDIVENGSAEFTALLMVDKRPVYQYSNGWKLGFNGEDDPESSVLCIKDDRCLLLVCQ
ncbi:hypothetical protein HK097_000020 [Rhizophlyctis rosea]|uniref:Uncharacterized protein n=1 Tax=Rhizophlyctis rosea TaxID=64517 RepID=A0AAD5SMG6_9FUNG|nr:hypothetical protein HK097_000020 [Rhizophlyctis rosea]